MIMNLVKKLREDAVRSSDLVILLLEEEDR